MRKDKDFGKGKVREGTRRERGEKMFELRRVGRIKLIGYGWLSG